MSKGLALERAVLAAGVSPTLWQTWRERAAAGDAECEAAVAELYAERARFEGGILETMLAHGRRSPQAWAALMTLLERTGPDSYSSKARIELEVRGHLSKAVDRMIDTLRRRLSHDSYAIALEAIAESFGVDVGSVDGSDGRGDRRASAEGAAQAPPTKH